MTINPIKRHRIIQRVRRARSWNMHPSVTRVDQLRCQSTLCRETKDHPHHEKR